MYSFPTLDDVFRASSVFSPRVYVVSDSQYQDMKKARVQNQIDALEARADEYRKYLETVEVSIKELKEDIGLLEPAKEKAKKK